jgi:hypothetical protein
MLGEKCLSMVTAYLKIIYADKEKGRYTKARPCAELDGRDRPLLVVESVSPPTCFIGLEKQSRWHVIETPPFAGIPFSDG